MDEESRDEINTIVNKASSTAIGRGMILELSTQVEDLLTSIIAWCFSPTYDELDGEIDSLLNQAAIALKSIILGKIDFSEKIRLFKDCVQFVDENVFKSNSQLIKQIESNLDKVRKFRNLLAHAPMDTSTDYAKNIQSQSISDSDNFQVLEYKGGKVSKRNIDHSKLKTEMNNATSAWHQLLQLWALLRKRPIEAKQYESLGKLSDSEFEESVKRMGFRTSS